MKILVARRKTGPTPHMEQAAMLLAEDHYWTSESLQKNFGGFDDYWAGLMAFLPEMRNEAYLMTDGGEIRAIAVFSRQFDIHYGLIAVPTLVIVHSEHRNDVATSREVVRLIRNCVRELNVDRYVTCQHVNETTQIHKLRYLNGRS